MIAEISMRMRNLLGGVCILVVVIGDAAGCSSGPGPAGEVTMSWTLHDLGPGRCIAVNEAGQVLGSDDGDIPFIVDPGGTRTSLGAYGNDGITLGVAIAGDGTVVGYSEGQAGRIAVAYANGQWTGIPSLPAGWSEATGIGDRGQIAGMRGSGADGDVHAFIMAGGSLNDLPLPAARDSAALLASGDRVAGILETDAGDTHAFVIAGDRLTDLGTLGGATSAPIGMNARGDIVGAAETPEGTRHAFLAAAGRSPVDLGVPQGAATSEARGVDDHGRIVGNVYDADGMSRPVAFVAGKQPIDLIADAARARYVSASVASTSPDGRIAGWAVLRRPAGPHAKRCLLWTPGDQK